MIVHIFESGCGGHHTTYIRSLLPALTELRHRGHIQRILVTISHAHFASPDFADKLSQFSSSVDFDASLPDFDFRIRSSHAAAAALLTSISRVRPDYLIAPTADFLTVGLAGRSINPAEPMPGGVHSVGLFHLGFGRSAVTARDRLKDSVFSISRHVSRWSDVRIVNPLVYECLIRRGALPERYSMLPDPVARPPQLDRFTARRVLGIPVDGFYIGSIGSSDHRKAIPELLSAYRAATSQRTDRLLLAGRLYGPHQSLIERDYADLVRQERLIVLNRYLTSDELTACRSAIDVASVMYYPKPELSANILEAAFTCRPVIACAHGYTGMIIDRFKLGWSCDPRDSEAFVATIRTALAHGSEYRPSDGLSRLIQFHDPKNYTNTVLSPLFVKVGLRAPELTSWEWTTALA